MGKYECCEICKIFVIKEHFLYVLNAELDYVQHGKNHLLYKSSLCQNLSPITFNCWMHLLEDSYRSRIYFKSTYSSVLVLLLKSRKTLFAISSPYDKSPVLILERYIFRSVKDLRGNRTYAHNMLSFSLSNRVHSANQRFKTYECTTQG